MKEVNQSVEELPNGFIELQNKIMVRKKRVLTMYSEKILLFSLSVSLMSTVATSLTTLTVVTGVSESFEFSSWSLRKS